MPTEKPIKPIKKIVKIANIDASKSTNKTKITNHKATKLPKLASKQQIEAIFSKLQAQNPSPKTELNYTSTFELLIAVLLSAQSTDIAVNKATHKLFLQANTPHAMLLLGEEGLIKHIQSIGLYKAKAKHILQTCQLLIQNFNAEVPNTMADLIQLPGVGQKTANVVLNTAFGLPTIAVDTHLFRLAHRLGLSKGNTPEKVELDLLKRIPKIYHLNAHHWLILHGRYVCKAQSPQCKTCILAMDCNSCV
jgi:endonuclease-3